MFRRVPPEAFGIRLFRDLRDHQSGDAHHGLHQTQYDSENLTQGYQVQMLLFWMKKKIPPVFLRFHVV